MAQNFTVELVSTHGRHTPNLNKIPQTIREIQVSKFSLKLLDFFFFSNCYKLHMHALIWLKFETILGSKVNTSIDFGVTLFNIQGVLRIKQILSSLRVKLLQGTS